MTKTELKTAFYDYIKVLETDGIHVQGSDSDIESYSPLVTYSLVDKSVDLIQDRIERQRTIYFLVKIYGDNSVQCTEISDEIDSILLPIGFRETTVSDSYDKTSRKHSISSVYAITIDENGYVYNIK